MPEYRLLYFNLRGRAEPIRWIFKAANQSFEDERIDREKDWPQRKKDVQYGKVPILFVDGKPISQSVAICRYLGREFGLCPEDSFMAAIGDEVVDAVHDLLPLAAKILYAKLAGNLEEAKTLLKDFNDGVLKNTLTVLESKLNEHKWFGGEKMTWVDIFVGCYLSQLSSQNQEVFEAFPCVKDHFNRVGGHPPIQAWIKERPETPL